MENPKYLVNISYQPKVATGQTAVSISGATQSMTTYRQGYYIASMPELKVFATGPSYTDALDNLLVIATASSTENPGIPPLNTIRTW